MTLTGLDITQMMASGQYLAQASDKSRTIAAFVLNRSSLVIPATKNHVHVYVSQVAVTSTHTGSVGHPHR